MMKNLLYFFALCLLAVKAQTEGATETPTAVPAKNAAGIKVSPQNVSALYIGDLLRTKPKEVLEVAGSVHQPIFSNRGFVSHVHPKPVAARSYNYKAHGGHEYLETEFIHPSTESRSSLSSHPKGLGTSARVVPIMGHLLTLKPVRVVPRDAYPQARNSGAHQKSEQYSNEDCSKSGEHSYSNEDKSYGPEQKAYRRAKQISPEHQPEYRSPQSSYDEDDRSDAYSSHSGPSSTSHNSKSYPSGTNTKSHSSGSYTKSKSTSSSRTVSPNRPTQKARIMPTTVSHAAHYEKDLGPAHVNQDIIVYKVKEPPSKQRPSSYSENTGSEYPASNYENEYKAEVNSPFSQYPPEVKKSRKQSHTVRGHHSNSEPKQYGPAAYEQEKDNYSPSSYGQPEDQRYTEQNAPPAAYQQEPEYAPHSALRGQEPHNAPYQGYQNPGSGRQYEVEDKKSHSRKPHQKPVYGSSSHDGREDSRYRAREPSTQGYDYSIEQPIQSSRPRNHGGYNSYGLQDSHTDSGPSQTYDRSQPALRPSEEKEMNQYAYEPTPHQVNIKQSPRTHRRQNRESSRSVRSPGKYAKSVIVDGRTQLPVRGSEPLIMVSRESKPYISHSVSYSQSGFGADENPEPNHNFRNTKERFQSNPTTEGRQNSGFDPAYPTTYKPFNSEYPASYANDPHHRTQQQYQPRDYEAPQQPYEQPNSYEENPSQYQPYEEHQRPYEEQQRPYEQDGPHDASYEENDAPAKKNKNHKYISKVEGYRDEYSSSTPLHLDDAFFEKYGISKNAKIIVAEPMKPNLLVADGTKVEEGGHSGSSGHYEEERYEPNHDKDFEQDSYSESPEPLGAPRQIPGNFEDLVKTNPRILRKLPQIMSPVDAIFKLQDSDDSFDDADFRNAEQKGFIVSQGPREIVQQHGDGVSRILFNVPKGEGRADASNDQDYKEENRRKDEEKIIEAASEMLENIIKSEY